MQQNGFHDDADAAQQEKHDGQLLQPLSADVRGEEPGQPGGAEGGGQRDKAEAQGGAVQEQRYSPVRNRFSPRKRKQMLPLNSS